jgi:Phage tail assembly chaperone protein, TAC
LVHVIDWGQLWAYARVDLGLSDAEFWRLTLYELDLLTVRHRRVQHIEDRRAALAAWRLANAHRDSEKKREPFSFEDVVAWLGTPYARPQPVPKRATMDEVKQNLGLIGLFNQGLS